MSPDKLDQIVLTSSPKLSPLEVSLLMATTISLGKYAWV